ncbi:MAG: fatty acid desaturase, partial [Pseudobdellovibrionaceae bacterium]
MHLRYAEPTRQEEDFFRILKKRVFARLHEKNQTRYANLNMWLRVTFFFTGFFASWSCLVFAQMPVALTLAFCVLLSFFGTGIALNVGHETSHGNLSPRPWVNSFLYRFSMSLLGTSDLNWKTGHIETHHKYVNVGGSDVGVEANGALRFTAHTKWFPKFRYQHFFAIPLYCFYTLAWVIFRDWRVLLEGQVSGAKLNPSFKKFFDLFLIK